MERETGKTSVVPYPRSDAAYSTRQAICTPHPVKCALFLPYVSVRSRAVQGCFPGQPVLFSEQKGEIGMKQGKKLLAALLAALMVMGAIPAYAAQLTEMPDYFGIQSDAEKVMLDDRYTLSYGRSYEVMGSFEMGDDFCYAIQQGDTVTVTNTHPSDTGFVYLYCEVYYPKTALVNEAGQTEQIPGGYFTNVDEQRYYLKADGQWKSIWYGYWLLGAIMDGMSLDESDRGMMLDYGQSCTFTLPREGEDALYLLYCYYMDPQAAPDYEVQNTDFLEYQRNVYRYEETASTVAGFSDVRESDYYAQAVEWAKETGVTGGTSATTFSPDRTVTRAQAMTFLWRAAGSPSPASMTSPFTDVTDPGAYYYKAILWAAEQGITGGVGGGRFGVDGTLPYDQILAMLCRAAGGTASGSDWSAAAVRWAEENGLTSGLTFAAKEDCPRADVVYCLWKQMSGQPIPPADPEEDGDDPAVQQISEEQVYHTILALKDSYPEGMRWTNDDGYISSALHIKGYGCAGFAMICSDAAFGDLPGRTHESFDDIRVGDMIRIGDYHSVVVLEKRADSVIVTEGNYNSSIHWGREITRSSLEQTGFYVTTRYPAG